jgi:hypothetical protein
MIAGCGVDELGVDPHTAAALAHAALENVANAKLPRDLFHIDRAALVTL